MVLPLSSAVNIASGTLLREKVKHYCRGQCQPEEGLHAPYRLIILGFSRTAREEPILPNLDPTHVFCNGDDREADLCHTRQYRTCEALDGRYLLNPLRHEGGDILACKGESFSNLTGFMTRTKPTGSLRDAIPEVLADCVAI